FKPVRIEVHADALCMLGVDNIRPDAPSRINRARFGSSPLLDHGSTRSIVAASRPMIRIFIVRGIVKIGQPSYEPRDCVRRIMFVEAVVGWTPPQSVGPCYLRAAKHSWSTSERRAVRPTQPLQTSRSSISYLYFIYPKARSRSRSSASSFEL